LVLILRYYIDQGEIANSLLREKLKGIERRSKGSKRGWLDRKKEAKKGTLVLLAMRVQTT